MIEEYFYNAKEQMKGIIEGNADIMLIVNRVYTADVLRIPKNRYPAICLEADDENPTVGTSKVVRINLGMNIWFYIPITLANIKEEVAERNILKIGAGMVKLLSANETNQPYWVKSDYESVEYGFKETDRLLRTGVIRWTGETRISGGW